MANPQLLDDILGAVVAAAEGLGLELDGDALPVFKRKRADRRTGVEPGACVIVAADPQPDSVRFYAFGKVKTTWRVTVAVYAPGNADLDTNLLLYTQWRSSLEAAFRQPPLVGVAEVADLDIGASKGGAAGDFLPQQGVDKNYDVQTVHVLVSTVEAV